MRTIETIGFIGLGAMGGAMSRNLLKAGFKVVGHDRLAGATDGLVAAGGATAFLFADEGARVGIVDLDGGLPFVSQFTRLP